MKIENKKGYRNDRNRPYGGSPHMTDGIRGKQNVEGLTVRDVRDCLIQAFLASSGDPEIASKCFEISNDPDRKDSEYADKGDWQPKDVYKVDLKSIDPMAVCQNLMCFIEYYMGIYPNTDIELREN